MASVTFRFYIHPFFFLEGGALAVYLEMSTDDQGDVKKLKKNLMEVFLDSQFVAFNQFKSLRWNGESVDGTCMRVRY